MAKFLYLPAITGQYGTWRYYQAIMRVADITDREDVSGSGPDSYRVKTVEEVKEIYSKDINEMLQRLFDPRRLQPITNYILRQPDRYVNNLTLAIYGGAPEWVPMEVSVIPTMRTRDSEADMMAPLQKTFGFIRLTGNEILFVLDGQHRVRGLREAVAAKPKLGSDEIAITLISHKPSAEGKKRTRRLFTTVNRYAKPVTKGESILLDEDDVSAILVRRLIEEYPLFAGKDRIGLNKTADLKLPKDDARFSTVLALWSINERLIDHKAIYPKYEGARSNLVRIRPDDAVIGAQTKVVSAFWDTFFKTFPKARSFVEKPDTLVRRHGGPFSLRPIGQQIFADLYVSARQIQGGLATRIRRVPDDLSDPFWRNVLFFPDTGTMGRSIAYARAYLFYHLGIPLSSNQKQRLIKNIKDNRGPSLGQPRFV